MKTVFITGANRGIGLGLAKHYLNTGCTVWAAARNPERSSEFSALQESCGERFVPIQLDVASEASINQVAAQLAEKKMVLDLVINNAGISLEENCGQWTTEHFERHFGVNAIGPALIAQALAPLMIAGSKLINLTSGMGSVELNINALTGLDAYAMSKAALNMLTRRLGEKLRAREVIAIAISPGWVQTEMGGAGATATVEEAVASLTGSIEKMTMEQSGLFFSESGEQLPW